MKAQAAENLVSVCVPYYGCPDFVRASVESILAQTHRNLVTVVIADGDPSVWDRLRHVDDPRLVRFDLDQNRGLFFCRAIHALATPAELILTHDADDWLDPRALELLLAGIERAGAVAAIPSVRDWDGAEPVGEHLWPLLEEPVGEHFLHRCPVTGLARTSIVRAVGHAGFRIGFDTYISNVYALSGRVCVVREAVYNRSMRPDSLTRCAEFGRSSENRRRANADLVEMYNELLVAARRHDAPSDRGAMWLEEVLRISDRRLGDVEREALRGESERLRDQISRVLAHEE